MVVHHHRPWLQPRWVGAVTQSNGTKLPLLGLGTWLSADDELRQALRVALDAGYRYIDTAFFYNNEHIIGEVLQEYYDAGKLKRSDLFLTTKLGIYLHRPEDVQDSIQHSLKALRTDYIDLYLIHIPTPFKRGSDGKPEMDGEKMIPDLVPLIDTWRVMEEYYRSGVLRSLGVSNFTETQLLDLYDQAEIKPHNHQVEVHVKHPQHRMINLCRELGISVTAYGPLGSPGRKAVWGEDVPDANCLGNPLVIELARKYKKTPAQILIRQMMQRGISVIPKSTNPSRIRENFDVFDFHLTQDELQKFNDITDDVRLFDMPL
jgi:alcohol dehydrogenase (NADP+)